MIEIASDRLTASINPFGAELSSLRTADGVEWLHDGDPTYWTGRSPLLFPIVGALNGGVYHLDAREYALPQHGFARRRAFALVEQGADRARFRLVDDAETRSVYPFAFALDAEYRIEGDTLVMAISVTNRGDADMPASFGFHPAFVWPREGETILFEREEGPISLIEGGLIGVDAPSPLDGCELALSDTVFAQDALVWRRIASPSLRFRDLDIGFPDAPMLGIWSKPGAPFVCVEPWWGHADPVGFTGEIWEKPGMMRFAPGETRTFTMCVSLRG